VTTVPSLFAEPPEHLRPRGNKFLVFTVEDLDRASDELESKGVRIIWRERQCRLAFGPRPSATSTATSYTSCTTEFTGTGSAGGYFGGAAPGSSSAVMMTSVASSMWRSLAR
jgi:hypothetical protein